MKRSKTFGSDSSLKEEVEKKPVENSPATNQFSQEKS
jgi:hypothetical protein